MELKSSSTNLFTDCDDDDDDDDEKEEEGGVGGGRKARGKGRREGGR